MPSTYACMVPGLKLVGRRLAPTDAPLRFQRLGLANPASITSTSLCKDALSSSDGCRPVLQTLMAPFRGIADGGSPGGGFLRRRLLRLLELPSLTAQRWRSCSDATRVVVDVTMATSRRPRSLQRTAPMRGMANTNVRMSAVFARVRTIPLTLCAFVWSRRWHLGLQPGLRRACATATGRFKLANTRGTAKDRPSSCIASSCLSLTLWTPCAPTNWRRARRN